MDDAANAHVVLGALMTPDAREPVLEEESFGGRNQAGPHQT